MLGKTFDLDIFKRLIAFAKPYKLKFFIASSSVILLGVVSSLVPYTMILTVDDFTITKNADRLLNFTVILFTLLFLQVFLQFVFIYFANWVGQHIVKDMRIKTFDKIINFKMQYFNTNAIGRLVTRVVSDIETVANFFSQGLFTVISDLLKMFLVIVLMLYINWKLALITLSVLPILLYATRWFQRSIKLTFQEVRNQVANLNTFVQERITGMMIVQIFNREQIEYDKFKKINKKFREANIKTVWYYSIFFPITDILSSIAIGLLVWYGGGQIIENQGVKIGAIIGFISMAQMMFRPLRQIADKFNQLQMGIVSAERVFKVLDTDSSIQNLGLLSADEIKGNIQFNNVRFSYIEQQKVLKGVSFDIQASKTVAIVGSTGAGKSTIINLISRFYEIDSGEILIDKVPIKDYELHSLRKKIAVVLQDVFLFSDTILNNITLNTPNISFEEVVEGAKKIGIHDFIMSLPNQYNYNVKERGGMLSSGQRQLIAFLRAYVSQPRILILDEATSSVDTYSEQMIQYATEKLTKNRTSIVIAHRLATIKQADSIIVMDKGLIVEQGNHNELLALKGFYYNLYNKQFKV